MTTKELISDIAAETGLNKTEVSQLLNATSETISEQLLAGKDVHIQNFGVLEVKQKKERVCVHPRTGERTLIPQKMQVSFKQNAVLKEQINTK